MHKSDSYIPLSVPSLKGNELKYVSQCINTEWVSTAGSFVTKFENELSSYVGSKYAVAVCNGTSALHLSLIAAGVKPGDEVIVPTITFIAPVNTIKYVNANPVFIDCDDHLNISAGAIKQFIFKKCVFKNKKLINKISGRPVSAIIPVHVFGHPVEIEDIMSIADEHNLKVIEDATESLGSYYISGKYSGKKTGTIGHLGCYSFNGNKIITTGGGGMVVSDNAKAIEKIRYLSTQAKDDALHYVHNGIGYNYRMTNIQAAIGCAQLEKIDEYIKIKRNNFNYYSKGLENVDGISFIKEPVYSFSNYWFYSLLIDTGFIKVNKQYLIGCLKENKIESRPIWKLNHLQKPYKKDFRTRMIKAPFFYERILNLPCSVNIKKNEIDRVVGVIKECFL